MKALLQEIKQLGGEEITLIGGELFLRPDWQEISEAVISLGMRIIFISNGLLIDQSVRNILKEMRPKVIGISLDGATRETYTQARGVDAFDAIQTLLQDLVADGHAHVNAITTFTTANLNEFDAFCELYENSEICWQVQVANTGGERFDRGLLISRKQYSWLTGKMKDLFANANSRLKLVPMDDFGYFPLDPALGFLHQTWRGCIAGLELVGIRSNGDVLGCLSLGDDFVEENIRTTPLTEIWESGRYFTQFRDKEKNLKGECQNCAFGSTCRAGCACMAYSGTGSIHTNPYCIRSIETEAILKSI